MIRGPFGLRVSELGLRAWSLRSIYGSKDIGEFGHGPRKSSIGTRLEGPAVLCS